MPARKTRPWRQGGPCPQEPADAHTVGPGHDAWVVGDEPCIALDFAGAADLGACIALDFAGAADLSARNDARNDAPIERTIEAYLERLNASDVRGVVDLYTDDGVLMEPEQDTAVGKQQLEASYDAWLRHRRSQLSHVPL